MYPMLFIKKENVITFAINNSRRTATPNLRAFYLCTIVKVSYYFCTIENYKSSSAPSKFFSFSPYHSVNFHL